MSLIEQTRRRSAPSASIPQVVAGTLVTIVSLFTAQMAALTAWVDTYGAPGGLGADRVDALGRPLSGWSHTWHTYGPLLWGAYALVLLVGVYLMWRAVLGGTTRAGWRYVLLLLALSALFWALELERFPV